MSSPMNSSSVMSRQLISLMMRIDYGYGLRRVLRFRSSVKMVVGSAFGSCFSVAEELHRLPINAHAVPLQPQPVEPTWGPATLLVQSNCLHRPKHICTPRLPDFTLKRRESGAVEWQKYFLFW